jgi:hypothetical protein
VTNRFRSKVDALVLVPILVGLGLPLLLLIRAVVEGRPLAGILIHAAILLAITPILHVNYRITGDTLVVRQGWLRWRLPLAQVRTLKATRQIWSSPALSLDRIEIRTDHGLWLLVSPADKAGFINAVRAKVPDVALEGFPTLAVE